MVCMTGPIMQLLWGFQAPNLGSFFFKNESTNQKFLIISKYFSPTTNPPLWKFGSVLKCMAVENLITLVQLLQLLPNFEVLFVGSGVPLGRERLLQYCNFLNPVNRKCVPNSTELIPTSFIFRLECPQYLRNNPRHSHDFVLSLWIA